MNILGYFPRMPVVFGIIACACIDIMGYALRENGITACACIGILWIFWGMPCSIRYHRLRVHWYYGIFRSSPSRVRCIAHIRRMGYMGHITSL